MKFADAYDAHHSLYTEDLPFWQSLAEEFPGLILELGSGTGRIMNRLADDGYRIIGLDYDMEMLQTAQIKQQAQTRAGLVCGDFLAIPLEAAFSLIIFPCNTFSTLDLPDRMGLLSSCFDLLEPGGCLTVSIPNPAVMLELEPESGLEVEEVIEFPQTETPLQISSGWERRGNEFILIWGYDLLREDGLVEHLEVRTRHIIQAADEILDAFRQAGFRDIQAWGDYDRSVYQPDASFLIVSAKK